MIFRVEETCTWEDWDAWRKTYTLHGRVLGGAVRATFGFQRAWGVFMMAFGGLLILLGLLGGLVNLITLIGAAALLAGVRTFRRKDAREGLADRRMEQHFRSNIQDKPMRFTFEDDGFSVWEPGTSGSYRYHAVTGAWEDEGRYYLFLQGQMRYILQKDAFMAGSPGEFCTFLAQKTGKAPEYIQ